MARYKKVESTVESATSVVDAPGQYNADVVVAEKVELGFSREKMIASENPSDYLASYVIPKYKDKAVKWPSRRHAQETFRGWKMLNWDMAKDELNEVKSIDEATKTDGNVLCWRDIRIEKALQEELNKKNREASRFMAKDVLEKEQLKHLNKDLSQILPSGRSGELTATPLGKEKDDDN